jgi:hypothetical protein
MHYVLWLLEHLGCTFDAWVDHKISVDSLECFMYPDSIYDFSNQGRQAMLNQVLLYSGSAVISFLTGSNVSFLPFKLCPVIFITSAVLIILGAFL